MSRHRYLVERFKRRRPGRIEVVGWDAEDVLEQALALVGYRLVYLREEPPTRRAKAFIELMSNIKPEPLTDDEKAGLEGFMSALQRFAGATPPAKEETK